MDPDDRIGDIVEVAVDYPTAKDRTFLYYARGELSGKITPGTALVVDFNKRVRTGYAISVNRSYEIPANVKIQPIKGIIDGYSIRPEMLELAIEVSKRYASTLAEVLNLMMPPGTKKNVFQKPKEKLDKWLILADAPLPQLTPKQQEIVSYLQSHREVKLKTLTDMGFSSGIIARLAAKGAINTEYRPAERLLPSSSAKGVDFKLTSEQCVALTAINDAISENTFNHFYLWGITGSGKTEIYRQAAKHAVNNGKSVLILIPEIALTPQLKNVFASTFHDKVSILHSGLSNSDRLNNWLKIYRGEARVVLGTRMAVFAPVTELGLIIVDEEHETTYKQNNSPRYHAKAVAVMRAKMSGAVLVYGSATPTVESYNLLKSKKIRPLILSKRINDKKLPKIELIDMKQETEKRLFSQRLLNAVEDVLEKRQKVMLFLNRRGFSRYLTCYDCGFVAICPNCSISLTYHKNGTVLCHYCGYQASVTQTCPKCLSHKIAYKGTGTQRVEDELGSYFKNTEIIRMDSDTTTTRDSHEKIIRRFESARSAILLGTQMIAKGLHFPEVSLVGIISADTILNMPDFRAAERTFQLMIQMAGRCGRGEMAGKVLVQTYNPEHYAIKSFASYDFDQFYKTELNTRKEAGYPPYTSLINIVVSSPVPENAEKTCDLVYQKICNCGIHKNSVLGPAPAPIYKLHGHFRWHILIKLAERDMPEIVNECHSIMLKLTQKNIRIIIDADPNWLL